MSRKLLPYEINILHKHNIDIADVSQYGEQPVDYIVGHTVFRNQDFIVNKNVLIPRIETEEIINYVALHVPQPNKKLFVLDLCTGSGCIGLSIFLELYETHHIELYLTDISAEALTVTKTNIQNLLNINNMGYDHISVSNTLDRFTIGENTVNVVQSNLFESIPKQKFDIIVSNPPYIPSTRIATLDNSVKDYEPHLALDGGEKGLDFIYQILDSLHVYLNTSGYAILEIDETHSLKDFHNYTDQYHLKILKDQFDQNRFLEITSKSI